jgi:hypothetical protein
MLEQVLVPAPAAFDTIVGHVEPWGTGHSTFAELPAGWTRVPQSVLDEALARTRTALRAPTTPCHFRQYYSRSGNFAGVTFLEVGPFDAHAVTEGDLLALSLLELSVEPAAVRRLLAPGGPRDTLNRHLSEESLPVDSDIRFANVDLLQSMEYLYLDVKRYVSKSGSELANPWVRASKLCARKRPDLFPVRDEVVCSYLGLWPSTYRDDWQVFRFLIDQRDVRQSLMKLVAGVGNADVSVGQSTRLLRHLDVVLWMYARSTKKR